MMMTFGSRVTLRRLLSDDQGTLGCLTVTGFSCQTIELPWRANAAGKSCIPAGTYRVRWSLSPRLRKWTYEILGVPGRSGIRIHGGNLAGDVLKGFISHSLGCPLFGSRAGLIRGQRAVLVSQPTVRAFETVMDRRDFELKVIDAAGMTV